MKKLLAVMFVALLMAGCGGEEELVEGVRMSDELIGCQIFILFAGLQYDEFSLGSFHRSMITGRVEEKPL